MAIRSSISCLVNYVVLIYRHCHFRSPLLLISLLISFPTLIDMLKFGVSSPLSLANNTLCGICMNQHLGSVDERSVHPASPVLLTR